MWYQVTANGCLQGSLGGKIKDLGDTILNSLKAGGLKQGDCRAPGRTAGWLAFAARRAGGGRSVRGVPMTAEHAKGALVWIRDDAAVWKAAESGLPFDPFSAVAID